MEVEPTDLAERQRLKLTFYMMMKGLDRSGPAEKSYDNLPFSVNSIIFLCALAKPYFARCRFSFQKGKTSKLNDEYPTGSSATISSPRRQHENNTRLPPGEMDQDAASITWLKNAKGGPLAPPGENLLWAGSRRQNSAKAGTTHQTTRVRLTDLICMKSAGVACDIFGYR